MDAASSAFEALTNNSYGIMEFYRRQAERAQEQNAEREKVLQAASGVPLTFPGGTAGVMRPSMEDYARALAGKKEGT